MPIMYHSRGCLEVDEEEVMKIFRTMFYVLGTEENISFYIFREKGLFAFVIKTSAMTISILMVIEMKLALIESCHPF